MDHTDPPAPSETTTSNPLKSAVIGLSTVIGLLLIALLWLGTRPAEQIVRNIEVQVPVKAKLVAVVVKTGDDLGTIGAVYQRSRAEMVGYNMDLLRLNTAKCDRLSKNAGVCRRDKFGEEELAFDAVWPGDTVLVITRDALEAPSFVSGI